MLKLHQVFLVGSGLAALVASGALLYLGDARGAVAAAIVATSVLVFWRARDGKPRLGRRHWLGLGLLGGGIVILGFPVGLVAGSFVVLFVLQLLLNAVVARNVGRITLERLDDPAVMPGAEEFVQQFSAEGFRIVGSYRFQTIGKLVVLTVMLGPYSDRLALVTDKVLQVSSRFGRRSLVTSNSVVAPVPADVLRQHVAGDSPVELVRAHDVALTLLDRQSIRPDVFASDAEALQVVREMEEKALAFVKKVSLRIAWRMETESGSQTRPFGDDPNSLSRINSWRSA